MIFLMFFIVDSSTTPSIDVKFMLEVATVTSTIRWPCSMAWGAVRESSCTIDAAGMSRGLVDGVEAPGFAHEAHRQKHRSAPLADELRAAWSSRKKPEHRTHRSDGRRRAH